MTQQLASKYGMAISFPGDSNNDGIPDAWETQYFGTININANADYDGNGLSVAQDYVAGYNPVDFFNGRPFVVQPSPLDAAAELTKMGAPDAFAASAGPDAGAGARHTRAMGRGASLPVSVFVMMAVGELFGAGAVSAYIAFALGLDARRYIGLAALLAQLGLAFAGARWARRRLGAPPTFDQRVRMAFGYTAGVTFGALAVLAVALIRFRIPHLDVRGVVMPLRLFADRGSVQSSVLLSLIVLAVFCAAVLLRYLLLTLFAPRR